MLVVEDDRDDVDMFKAALAMIDAHTVIRHINEGNKGLQFLSDCKEEDLPQVLLLDIQLPDINGPEMLGLLQQEKRYNRITKVVWSSSQRLKDMEDCKHLGADQYFIKPSTGEELDTIVHWFAALFAEKATGSVAR